jgi:hypothetical protein
MPAERARPRLGRFLLPAATAMTLGTALAGPVAAQDPLSAIDWLSRSLAAQPAGMAPDPAGPAAEPPGEGGLIAREIGVAALDAPRLDAVGLLPAERAGLPRALWGMTPSAEIAERLARLGPDTLPALQRLALALLVAELDPPRDSDAATGEALLIIRLDRLVAFGALDQARALAEAAGPATPALFDRWLDLSLLAGDVAPACDALRANPTLSADPAERVYCLARGGDWAAADALLASAEAADMQPALRAALTRFLDPEADHDTTPFGLGEAPTPLMWQLADALGEAVPTAALPLAYAHADLGPGAGWKAQIEAAERLTRAGALTPNRLLGLYTDRAPAASGGVWERVRTVQALETALLAEDAEAAAALLPPLWALMLEAELETAFAELYAERLLRLPLAGDAAALVWRAGLLAGAAVAAHRRRARRLPPCGGGGKLRGGLARRGLDRSWLAHDGLPAARRRRARRRGRGAARRTRRRDPRRAGRGARRRGAARGARTLAGRRRGGRARRCRGADAAARRRAGGGRAPRRASDPADRPARLRRAGACSRPPRAGSRPFSRRRRPNATPRATRCSPMAAT